MTAMLTNHLMGAKGNVSHCSTTCQVHLEPFHIFLINLNHLKGIVTKNRNWNDSCRNGSVARFIINNDGYFVVHVENTKFLDVLSIRLTNKVHDDDTTVHVIIWNVHMVVDFLNNQG